MDTICILYIESSELGKLKMTVNSTNPQIKKAIPINHLSINAVQNDCK